MSEGNKALVRRLVEGWQDGHRREVAEELLADDFADHSARPGEIATKSLPRSRESSGLSTVEGAA